MIGEEPPDIGFLEARMHAARNWNEELMYTPDPDSAGFGTEERLVWTDEGQKQQLRKSKKHGNERRTLGFAMSSSQMQGTEIELSELSFDEEEGRHVRIETKMTNTLQTEANVMLTERDGNGCETERPVLTKGGYFKSSSLLGSMSSLRSARLPSTN